MKIPSRLLAPLLLSLGVAAQAQPAPYHHWRTLDTPHFHVHVAEGLEREGRVAGAAAERAYAQLSRELVPPRGPIELVVSDDADYSNGSASPFPVNRIIIFAVPPIEAGGLGLSEDWIGLVITHELTHIFHLDRSRGIWGVAQHVFGRAPFLFPNIYSPSWLTEGLAVYYESRLTPGGRLRSAEHRDIARAAAEEGALPQLGDLSLGRAAFPGGESVYSYGSLFMEYLSRTRGDSTIPQFVERQSGELFPLFQARAAHAAFGITLGKAFSEWRDSVQHSVSAPAAPLPAWHELTTLSYDAPSPRWVDDSTIVYTASDGRESNAAYTVTLGGRRTRLGRRSGAGANVPLPDGGLLFAQPDFVSREVVRSDLWIERDGVQRRVTHGARLIEPDRARDGGIVAVQLDAGRASLVLVDDRGAVRMLREAGPDESWSEPRWSPDGRRLVAVHRAHGGVYTIEVVEPDGRTRALLARTAILSSPAWEPGGAAALFVSEETGTPQVYRVELASGAVSRVSSTSTAISGAEPSPDGRKLAAALLRADGYHVGVGSGTGTASRDVVAEGAPARPDTEPLAAGAYRDYDALPRLVPRYWMPVLEGGIAGGARLGAFTSGADPIGRHAYSGFFALQTNGRFATGGLSYSYAGLRAPVLGVALSQDWTARGRIVDSAGVPVGELERRIQDLAVAATFIRPRYRTYAALTAGVGLERRRYATDPAPLLGALDPFYGRDYTWPRAFVGLSWSNAQHPRLAISREDGVSLGLSAAERFRTDDASGTVSSSVVGNAFGYKSLDLPGFAHHVLALRVAGGLSDRHAVTSFEVGGTSGGTLDLVPGLSVGEGRRTFGVRGFPAAAIYGTQAVAGSLEYRAPLVVKGRGSWLIPAFFDRSSVSAFADAGSATCASGALAGICSPAPVIGRTIASVGGELGLSFALFQVDLPELVRVGVAVPVAGREVIAANVAGVARASAYVALGYSF